MKRIDENLIAMMKSCEQESRSVSLDDLVMVRTQDHFPTDGWIVPKGEANQYEEMSPNQVPYRDVFSEWGIPYLECKTPVYQSARGTVHFTLNGLVSNHMLGDFSGRKYYVFDLLQNHLEDSILSLRPEDTYIKGRISFSPNACICMSEDTLGSLSEEERRALSSVQLYVYDSSLLEKYTEEDIVFSVLYDLGKPFLSIGQHGYRNLSGELEDKMRNLVNQVCEQYQFGCDRHFQSQSWMEDFYVENERIASSLEGFLDLLVSTGETSDTDKEYLLDQIHFNHGNVSSRDYAKFVEIVRKMGKEFYEELVDTYNQGLMKTEGKTL